MRSNLMSPSASWTAARVLTCVPASGLSLAPDYSPMGGADVLVDERRATHGTNPRGVQRPRSEQGRRAFAGMAPLAPTALKGAGIAGVTGPYPWRLPV